MNPGMPDAMISVMHLTDSGGPGGAETIFLQTATGLDRSRYRSVAVASYQGWLAEQLVAHAVTPHIVSAKGSFNVSYLLRLLRLARQQKVDVIVAHLYGSAVYASLAGMILSIPVVSVLHGQTDVPESDRFASLKSAIVRHGSRKVVFVSERLEEVLAPRLRLDRAQCAVIPNGVDTEAFRPCPDRSLRTELGLADDTILAGAIGNVRTPKAYEVLLRAARLALDRSPRLHFVIAGDNANALGRDLVELARTLRLERHMSFLGLRSDIARILNNLDAFVLTSRTEGFSIACVEAMACGIPVISTRSGGPEEILSDDAGILVPVDDPEAIAGAIERVLASKDLASSLTATGLRRVHQEYSLGKMLARYEDLIASVVRPGNPGQTIRASR